MPEETLFLTQDNISSIKQDDCFLLKHFSI